MRITNISTNPILISDIDRGLENEIYESWNAKADNGVAVGGYIDVLDTESVLMSTEFGQIKKLKDTFYIETAYSITGTEVGPFEIDGTNDSFKFVLQGVGSFDIPLPHGSEIPMSSIVSTIASGVTHPEFVVEESPRFFRSSFMVPITEQQIVHEDRINYGQRGESILEGFLVLVNDTKITIGTGTANKTLGFTTGDCTFSK